ncbi:uncharacterized protein LOC111243843 isoform X2 [Varroa destructor]|uniref:Tudor domain-containing protein n=1 Tax=Varroa destructor TaxID=109461 RepID=A0A7M7J833_VARDE|nr:uncharacterized protein LOC111243843 isoform X2 [Varroa destructor]
MTGDSNSCDGAVHQSLVQDCSNRNYGHNGPNNNNKAVKSSPRRSRTQTREKESMRGIFEIISISDSGQVVALETGWKNDINKLTDGLAGYADFSKPGVDDMEPDSIYAYKDGENWRRCRMISRHGPGRFLVELIDYGGTTTTTRDKILTLSQLYKDWSVKSMDVLFAGHSLESGSQDNIKELQDILLNKSVQLAYTQERTGPQQRDRISVTEIKQQNANMLEVLVEKGLLKKEIQQRYQQQPYDRPLSQQTVHNRPQRQDRPPLRPQRPITKSGSGPQRSDARPRHPHEASGSGNGTQIFAQDPLYACSVDQPLQQQISFATKNSWGTAEACNEDSSTERWAAQQVDTVAKKFASDWNDQRENRDPQTSWRDVKQWTTTEWDDGMDAMQSTSAEQSVAPVTSYSQQHQRKSPKGQHNREITSWANDRTNSNAAARLSDWDCDVESAGQAELSTTHYQLARPEGRPLRGHSRDSVQQALLSQGQKKKTPSVQSENEDVFSSAGDWSDSTKKESPKAKELQRRVKNLTINGGNSTDKCERCVQLTNRVNTLESSLYSLALQKLISARLTNISSELRQVKISLAQLRLDPASQENETALSALAHCRREGRVRVREVEELLLTASAETLASFGMNGWSQFVGVIWKPMMDLQYLDERPLSVHKGTVIRHVVLEDDGLLEAVNPSQQPSENSPERATVILERAIEIPRMFPVLQDLAPNRAQGRVNSVFFSEDNSKVFIQLECPQSVEEDLEEYAKSTIALLTELRVIDQ